MCVCVSVVSVIINPRLVRPRGMDSLHVEKGRYSSEGFDETNPRRVQSSERIVGPETREDPLLMCSY